jgi:hypothetical protein
MYIWEEKAWLALTWSDERLSRRRAQYKLLSGDGEGEAGW